MVRVHCENCDGIFESIDFDTEYHSNGYCKDRPKTDYDKLPFKEKYFGEIISICAMTLVLGLVIGFGLYFHSDASPDQVECISYRMVQHIWLNENNEVTYREPIQVCDVTKYGGTYRFSYYLQANFSKPWWDVYPSCEGAVFNNQSMNFICPNGTIAQEIRPYH